MTLMAPTQFEAAIMSPEMDDAEAGRMTKTSVAGSIMVMVSTGLLAAMMLYCMWKPKEGGNDFMRVMPDAFGKRIRV